ncbi:hypothetical protein [Nocardia sp. NPDC005825]|uniref:hypothetical protein n=1 Tax=unclassified Nocardia TaxID=2637762 RepID=UPI0033E754C9
MDGKDFRPVLVEMATMVWRLQSKLAANSAADGDDSARLLNSLSRQVDSMAHALADAGVQVQSHTGEAFDPGQSVEVIAFAPTDSADRETVLETITPTVYLDGRLVQRGQIIVATPELAQQLSEDPHGQIDR